MDSLDELFKGSSSKRKADVSHDPDRYYKSIKTKVEAPEDPEPEEPEATDEDGRFFGGGITRNTSDVLDFVDQHEVDVAQPEVLDSAWLRKTALSFEKKISKNNELRAKFEDDPKKFMGSEADLDAEIKSLSILTEHVSLYPEFVELGCASSLVSLLSHENTDIAIDAIEIINELTDDSVEQDSWTTLVEALLDADLINLLHENLLRMDETNESDRAGIYHILEVLENVSSKASDQTAIKLVPWLLQRVQQKERPTSQNKQYASEILAILLQSSKSCRDSFITSNGIDVGLQLLSPYRRKDPPKGDEEEEMIENLFDCLVCCVREVQGKDKLVEAEGIELCLIMVQEGKLCRPRALRLLDHALSGPDGFVCCKTLVERAGLKTIFGGFMKKQEAQSSEHTVGILASLLRSLPAHSAARIRLMAKFGEKDWQSISRLVQIDQDMHNRMSAVEAEIAAERKTAEAASVEQEDEWLSRRLDAGLCLLQTVAIVLAWLAAEDDVAARRVGDHARIRKVLTDQLAGMDADDDAELRDILRTLLDCLDP